MKTTEVVNVGNKSYTTWHGAPFDRGQADSYYHRQPQPHWYPRGTGQGQKINRDRMSPEEIQAYMAGFEHNEALGLKKEF